MFFGEGRIPIVQRMILADNEADRRAALDELLPLQRGDFYGVFKAMHGTPVTIRTIDPPLHEFLPKREELMVEIATTRRRQGETGRELDEKQTLLHRVEQLHEFNPMLGHRGVRLGITYPEITEMQTRAIIEAACQLAKEGVQGRARDHDSARRRREGAARSEGRSSIRVADEVMKEQGVKVKYLVGTMIEVPRGAVTADEIAAEARVLLVRHERPHAARRSASRATTSASSWRVYQDKKILDKDPFASLDIDGRRAARARWASRRAAQPRPDLKVGICGEHGGDPSSIHFFDKVGLDYVSARRTACRWRGSRRRRRRCRSRSAIDA